MCYYKKYILSIMKMVYSNISAQLLKSKPTSRGLISEDRIQQLGLGLDKSRRIIDLQANPQLRHIAAEISADPYKAKDVLASLSQSNSRNSANTPTDTNNIVNVE